MRRSGALLGALLASTLPFSAAAQPAPREVPPTPTTFVTDQLGFLGADARARLEQRLEAHQGQTGQQVLVWIGPPPADGDIEGWAARTFSAWKPGNKDRDDGVVMFMLPAARKVRLEVGYGLEGYLPDAIAARIIGERMAPELRAGRNDAAIEAGVAGILEAVTPAAEGRPPPEPERARGGGGGQFFLILLVVLAFLMIGRMHPAGAAGGLYTIGRRRRSSGWWLGGGGFGGGGFGGGGFGGGGGGFGGGGGGGFSGGGGSSGGGGATGSW